MTKSGIQIGLEHRSAYRFALIATKITRAVDRLVEKGLVVRAPDKADRRRVVLRLSARGARASSTIEKVRQELEVEFLGVLSKEELASFYAILEKLEAHAKRIFKGKGTSRA